MLEADNEKLRWRLTFTFLDLCMAVGYRDAVIISHGNGDPSRWPSCAKDDTQFTIERHLEDVSNPISVSRVGTNAIGYLSSEGLARLLEWLRSAERKARHATGRR